MSTSQTKTEDWILCSGCRALIYGKRYDRNLRVCLDCGRHGALTADQRLAQLLDPESVQLLETVDNNEDPLGFVDTKPYQQRLSQARAATGLAEAVVCAKGQIEGNPVVVAVMDFRFLGCSQDTDRSRHQRS
jgi:acyl-CoA carboxylase subunit beta